jgi:hypothetical protein
MRAEINEMETKNNTKYEWNIKLILQKHKQTG